MAISHPPDPGDPFHPPDPPIALQSISRDAPHLNHRSCFFPPCDVPKTVRLGGSVARALREPILIILQGFTWFSAG